jgi:hypothetical protein
MAFLSAPLIEEVRFATEPPLHTGRSLQLRNRPPETAQRFDALAHLRWHSLHINQSEDLAADLLQVQRRVIPGSTFDRRSRLWPLAGWRVFCDHSRLESHGFRIRD